MSSRRHGRLPINNSERRTFGNIKPELREKERERERVVGKNLTHIIYYIYKYYTVTLLQFGGDDPPKYF